MAKFQVFIEKMSTASLVIEATDKAAVYDWLEIEKASGYNDWNFDNGSHYAYVIEDLNLKNKADVEV